MQKFNEAVNRHAKLALDALDYLWKNPETGYREWKGNAYLLKVFRALGYEPIEAGNIPGFYVDVDTGRPGPTVAVMGEMDSLLCESHPDADPETGAVHACGHCCQAAALLGLAAAACNMAGNYVGAGLAMTKGSKITRPVILLVLVLLFLKVLGII